MKYVNLRAMAPIEYPLLANFLYEAIFVPPGAQAPARSVLQQPQLQVYTANFGTQKGDFAFVAEQEGQIIGAAWCRLMKDYGHYREDVPSMAIAVLSPYRGQGIGGKLLQALLQKVQAAGYPALSLSVQKANPAVRLYQRAGFRIVAQRAAELIMLCMLQKPAANNGYKTAH